MTVKNAKKVARQWVIDEGSKIPGVYGAFFHGSANWLSDNEILPSTSDLDVMLVFDAPLPPDKRGKFVYRNVLLEVSYLPLNSIRSAEQVLGDYHLAGSFHVPSVIFDPSEQLTRLQAAVSKEYANRDWVEKRCEHAQTNVRNGIASLNESASLSDQVTTCLFAAGVTTHILLVAGLKNPTVRRRYLAVRDLLTEYDRLDFYEPLLELLGCACMSRERAEQHLAALAETFDVAKAVILTPYQFAADLSDSARPVAIDGSREMIERGDHREAIFWIGATFGRCQTVLSNDASAALQDKASIGYQDLIADLGLATVTARKQRCEQIHAFLPRVCEVAEKIMSANPKIRG